MSLKDICISILPQENELRIRVTKWLKAQARKPEALDLNPDSPIN